MSAHERLNKIAALVEQLGHEVVGRSVEIKDVGALSRETGAEVALVGLGLDSQHGLDLITSIVHEEQRAPSSRSSIPKIQAM